MSAFRQVTIVETASVETEHPVSTIDSEGTPEPISENPSLSASSVASRLPQSSASSVVPPAKPARPLSVREQLGLDSDDSDMDITAEELNAVSSDDDDDSPKKNAQTRCVVLL